MEISGGSNTGGSDAALSAALNSAQSALSAYEEMQRPEDLDEAVRSAEALARSPALTVADFRFRADALHLAARAHLARFASRGDASDLATARLWLQQARELVGADSADTGSFLDTLASGLAERFQQTADAAMLREALDAAEDAVALTPSTHPNRPGHLNNLASRRSDWFRHSDDARFLEAAIAALQEALVLTSEDHSSRPIYLTNLANRYSERYWRLRDPIDLVAGAAAAQEAVDRSPDDHPSRSLRLHNLANVLADRFDRFKKLADLSAAIQADDEALDLTPVGHPHERAILHNLATMYLEQFRSLGNLLSLEAALESGREAVDATPDNHRLKPAMLHTIASALSERFRRLGEIADLEAANTAAERAVVLTPEGDVDRPGRLNNLANMKFERFRRWDDLPDLDAAITANQKALTKERHPERATFLNNLSTMLSYRFRRLGEDTDLDCALAAAEEAVLLASDVSPDRPTYLNTLANRLLERFRKGGVISDLDAAIGAARKAADLTPHGNPDRHSYLNNLGMGLGLRFDRLQQKVDLHAAIEFVGEAVVLTPDGNPALPMYLNNLADLLHSRYRQSGEFSDLEAAIAAHKRAIPQLHASVTAEPQLSWLAGQASEHTRKIVGLLWRAGHFTQLAVAIENGRGVRLRADMIRADKAPNGLGEGEVVHFRDLVQQQRRLRAELERLRAPVADVQDFAARTRALDKTAMDSGPAADEISTQSILKEERRRTLLAEKLTLLFRLQEECKALEARDPNFDPPMPSFHELKELASACGDVLVYLLPISEDQGTVWQIISGVNESSEISAADQQLEESFTPGLLHALLANNPAVPGVEPMEPLGWLLATLRKIEVQPADLNVEAHAAAADIRRGTMDHVLAVLGRELISPLAKRLAEIGAKRVVLIPSGLLAFLPLHAAKIDENMTFGDLFEIRYCASATLLARARWLFLVGRQREG